MLGEKTHFPLVMLSWTSKTMQHVQCPALLLSGAVHFATSPSSDSWSGCVRKGGGWTDRGRGRGRGSVDSGIFLFKKLPDGSAASGLDLRKNRHHSLTVRCAALSCNGWMNEGP